MKLISHQTFRQHLGMGLSAPVAAGQVDIFPLTGGAMGYILTLHST